jgi:hypothetical protein
MNNNEIFDWLVIGGGPAGIAAVGSLLDSKVPQQKIGWIDPMFEVGDLGGKWQNVPSNTTVKLFLKYLHARHSFDYKQKEKKFSLDHLDPNSYCLLKEIVKPLQWITEQLHSKVKSIRGEAIALRQNKGCWEVKTKATPILAKNVILATGSEPKQLPFTHATIISLEIALDPSKLAKAIQPKDIVGVFGSSHSAVLILANLEKIAPRQIYNFYRSPHLYALDLGDWILFDNTGLKGFAADWARKTLDTDLPKNLERCLISDRNSEEKLALCTKIIYAVGFEKRKLPVIEPFPDARYQETIGVIAPHLFGLGIAYPQIKADPFGRQEYQVGLWKFIEYLNMALPIWLKLAN